MFNQALLIGHVTKDPETRYTPTGTAVTSFTVATNHKYKKGDETVEETFFGDITVFGKLAENCGQYLHKGSKVMVIGRLKTESWETEEGQKRSKTKIIANEVKFMDSKPKSEGQAEPTGNEGDLEPF